MLKYKYFLKMYNAVTTVLVNVLHNFPPLAIMVRQSSFICIALESALQSNKNTVMEVESFERSWPHFFVRNGFAAL